MKKGFTLIELLAVILILGIIALIAIPAVNDVIEDSKKGAEITTINNIITVYEDYYQLKTLKGADPDTIYMDCLAKNGADYKYTMAQIVQEIGIKGDIHAIEDYVTFKLDSKGNALVEYDYGNFTCSNFTESNGTVTVLPKGDCAERKNRSGN